jgi:hypothetical protein
VCGDGQRNARQHRKQKAFHGGLALGSERSARVSLCGWCGRDYRVDREGPCETAAGG